MVNIQSGPSIMMMVITSLLLYLCSTFAQATLSSRIDRNSISINESFGLILNSDQALDGEPELSVLKKDFKIINRQQSKSVQMINGQTTRSIQWQLTLMARRTGQLTIPVIHAGTQQSLAIPINVTQRAVQDSNQPDEDIFIQVEVDTHSAYVQEQILYTIKIFQALDSGIHIASGSTLSEPSFSQGEAVVKRLGEDRQYQGMFNNRPYGIIERRYSLYPQTSGRLEIQPLHFDARILKQQRTRQPSPFANLQQDTQLKRMQSKNISVEIKPVPKAFQGTHWLPARDVSLQESWSADITQLKVGEPITRTLSIETNSLSSAQIPEIEYTLPDDIKQYPDQAVLKDQLGYDGIHGSRQQKIALIANKTGDISLPAIDILWWNTSSDRQETVRIPAQVLQVVAAAPIVSNIPDTSVERTINIKPRQQASVLLPAQWWPWLTLCFALLWGITLVLWRRQRCPQHNDEKAINIDIKNIPELRKTIKRACKSNHTQHTHNALIAWARLQWPAQNIDSLGSLAARCEPVLAEEIQRLERNLYAQETIPWQGARLWQAFKDHPVETIVEDSSTSSLNSLFHHQKL